MLAQWILVLALLESKIYLNCLWEADFPVCICSINELANGLSKHEWVSKFKTGDKPAKFKRILHKRQYTQHLLHIGILYSSSQWFQTLKHLSLSWVQINVLQFTFSVHFNRSFVSWFRTALELTGFGASLSNFAGKFPILIQFRKFNFLQFNYSLNHWAEQFNRSDSILHKADLF